MISVTPLRMCHSSEAISFRSQSWCLESGTRSTSSLGLACEPVQYATPTHLVHASYVTRHRLRTLWSWLIIEWWHFSYCVASGMFRNDVRALRTFRTMYRGWCFMFISDLRLACVFGMVVTCLWVDETWGLCTAKCLMLMINLSDRDDGWSGISEKPNVRLRCSSNITDVRTWIYGCLSLVFEMWRCVRSISYRQVSICCSGLMWFGTSAHLIWDSCVRELLNRAWDHVINPVCVG